MSSTILHNFAYIKRSFLYSKFPQRALSSQISQTLLLDDPPSNEKSLITFSFLCTFKPEALLPFSLNERDPKPYQPIIFKCDTSIMARNLVTKTFLIHTHTHTTTSHGRVVEGED